jgi:hypothetical protein
MPEMQFVRVDEVDAHFHDPEWYRPLLFGDNLYMNVTYLLPGVTMVMGSAREREAEKIERAICVLSGTLSLTRGPETVEAGAGSAFLVPMTGDAVTVTSTGQSAASFVTVMSPPPHPELKLTSREQLRQLYLDSKRRVLDPKGMAELLKGGTR